MRKSVIILFSILLSLKVSSQVNLVANPSFEDTIPCSSGYPFDPATPAVNWMALGSADYFSDYYCHATVPLHSPVGFQEPFDGTAYFGISAYDQPLNSDNREYLFTGLTQQLQAGKKYCISFYVSLSDSMQIAIKNIGIAFTHDTIPFSGPNIQQYMLSLVPQFESTDIITDKIGWVKLSGEFIADGTERCMTIGNFRTFSNTTYQDIINNPVWPWSGAYYFIDMVSVIESPDADAGIDQSIITGDSIRLQASGGLFYSWSPSIGLSCTNCCAPYASPSITTTYIVNVNNDTTDCGSSDSITITVLPKPPLQFYIPTILANGDRFVIQSIPANSRLVIFDFCGKMIFQSYNYQNDFSTANLSTGNYLYEIVFSDQSVQKGKFCVIK